MCTTMYLNKTNGLSPHDMITRTQTPSKHLHDLHVWGCPVYVLHGDLADGKKIPRWKARSQRHVLMGLSDKHHSSAPLVLNPSTGTITTKYHVVYDSWFATIATSIDELPPLESSPWSDLFGTAEFHSDEDDALAEIADPDLSGLYDDVPPYQVQDQMTRVAGIYDDLRPPTPLNIPPPPTTTATESLRDDAFPSSSTQGQHQREISQPATQIPWSSPQATTTNSASTDENDSADDIPCPPRIFPQPTIRVLLRCRFRWTLECGRSA
jgi:hypothetical protein